MDELAGIFFSTFVAEDFTAVATGLLAREARVALGPALLACTLGIYVGDLGLWLLGRTFRDPIVRHPRLRAWYVSRAARVGAGLNGRLPGAILASRLLPGTRLPLYLTAGATGISFRRFAFWSFVAACGWTPTVVLATMWLGPRVANPLSRYFGSPWLIFAITAVLLVIALRIVTAKGARGLTSLWRRSTWLQRLWRWEFWPMWAFYGPVALWTVWLALRHGGFSTITAANPGIGDGGVVGESKYDILRRLPRRWTVPSIQVGASTTRERLRTLLRGMRSHGCAWPVILKPDVGQRGAGVRLARSLAEASAYLARVQGPVIAQPYHAGPYEAGIFYYRFPGASRGRILSITDKHFPFVVGDGASTIESLVLRHERYRMQARTFLARLQQHRHRVPAPGERVPLGIAGNHAQGTLFRDGSHLLTRALEHRIDGIAKSYEGFFIGRFDVRYSDIEAFKAGRDLAIVELNGATAECTEVYDPDNSLWRAYRTLFRQWSLVFQIGAANRAAGAPVTSRRRLVALIRTHLSTTAPFPVSD